MAESKSTQSRWLTFSIRTLLFVTLLAAGLFAGYPAGKKLGQRAGFEAGYRRGADARRRKDTLQTVVYPVSDLVSSFDEKGRPVPGEADFGTLIDLITTSIEAEHWDEVGGPGTIKEFERNPSLTVTQSPDVHEKIRLLLIELRKKPDWKSFAQATARQIKAR